ncbi:MAG: polysaccharide deacetylase family protein [Chloroflexi bacterium]|nr:polysaccharide deacetylase family protein [Chloroflexota bacterium]
MSARLFLMTWLAAWLVACASPASPTAIPAPSATIVLPTATPTFTPTFTPTRVPTPTSTPTAFVTPPATGEAANVPILMYHNLRDLPNNASELERTWTVAPKQFEAQIAALATRGFHTITMAQLVAHLKHQGALPIKPIVISFDDGWVEQYTVAYAVLKKYNYIGTFFIYTNPIDRAHYLTWAQLQDMSVAGMDIQAHTLTHPHLRALAPSEAQREISESKKIIESKLGKPVVAFAYPFGEYNTAVIEMLKRANLDSAVTLASGYRQRTDELYTLHRIRVSYGDTLDDFSKRLPQ